MWNTVKIPANDFDTRNNDIHRMMKKKIREKNNIDFFYAQQIKEKFGKSFTINCFNRKSQTFLFIYCIVENLFVFGIKVLPNLYFPFLLSQFSFVGKLEIDKRYLIWNPWPKTFCDWRKRFYKWIFEIFCWSLTNIDGSKCKFIGFVEISCFLLFTLNDFRFFINHILFLVDF